MPGYSAFDFQNSVTTSGDTRPNEKKGVDHKIDYSDVLERVRASISEKHATELSEALTNDNGEETLKMLIAKTLAENKIKNGSGSSGQLIDMIYQDMAGLGILTSFIHDPAVEEININSYNRIEIMYGDRTKYLEEGFASPTAAIDVVKKMARMGGKLLDQVTPEVDSYIGGGTRISAMIPPIVPDDVGVVASIRKQNKASITRDQLLLAGSATADELDFLNMCLTHSVSIGFAGGTGAGKTTDQGFLLNEYIRNNTDWNNRVYLIEDSREIMLTDWDEIHNRPARVVSTVTRAGKDEVSMRTLIKSALRFHPHLIVPVEVRGEEALEAANAGITGHTILTSLHAPDSREAYQRLLSMCTQAGTKLSEEALLELCVTAWPIMCYKEQLRDGSRKYMEIFEATGVKGKNVVGNMLYRFQVDHEETDENGRVTKVVGTHKRVGTISYALFNKLRQNGVPEEQLLHLFPDFNDKRKSDKSKEES